MLVFNAIVFDELVSGTNPLYTGNEHNDALGSGDRLGIMAVATNVTGSSVGLTVQVEHSGDAQNWIAFPSGSPEISVASLASNTGYFGTRESFGGSPLLSFIRLKVTLSGTTPACRLKITVTGRSA